MEVARRKYVAPNRATELRTKMKMYQRLSLTPKLETQLRSFEDITNSAEGVEHLLRKLLVDFGAQAMHEHIDYVRLRVEAVVPHVLQNHRFRDHAARMPHQVLKQ